MTVPLPSAGDTSWMDWASYIHDAATSIPAEPSSSSFYVDGLIVTGTATVATGVLPTGSRVGVATTLREFRVRVGTAPTGAALTVVLTKNGTAVSTVVIPAGSTSALSQAEVALVAGDILNFNITTIGSTVAGANVAASLSDTITDFTPASLTGLAAWYDVSEQSGATDGVRLTTLTDTAAALPLTGVTSVAPYYRANGFGAAKPAVDNIPATGGALSSGGYTRASETLLTGKSSVTVSCVATAANVADSSIEWFLVGRELGAKISFTAGATRTPRLLVSNNGTSWAVNQNAASGVTSDVPHVYTMILGGGRAVLRVDGTAVIDVAFTGSVGSNANIFGLGTSNTSGGEPFRGLIGDLVIADAVLAGENLILLENYLRRQAGMTTV